MRIRLLEIILVGCWFIVHAAGIPAEHWLEQIRVVIPQARALEELPATGEKWICGASGERLGQLCVESDPSARPTGFGGKVEVAMILDLGGRVAGVLVGENQETPSFLDRVAAAGYLAKWNGLAVAEAAEKQFPPVSGATYSSTAIARGVRQLSRNYLGAPAEVSGTLSAEARAALESELSQLESRISRESFVLARSTILLDQRQNRRAEELEFREILATRGDEAADAYAAEHGLAVSGHFRMSFSDSELARLGAAWRANPTEEALDAVRAEAARELDASLAGLLPHNVAHARSILAVRQRIQEIQALLK